MHHPQRISRRGLLAASTLAAAPRFAAAQAWKKVIAENDPGNIKVAHIMNHDVSDGFLLFCKQIGLRWARLMYHGDPHVDKMRAIQKRFASFGVGIYSTAHHSHRSLKLQLGQPGRDADIETYRTFLRSVGALGIEVASYDFHPANTYTTANVVRRGYSTREFSVDDFRKKVEKQRFEREYSADEIWASYTYFMNAVLPVAREAKVYMALHPDDPPLAKMNGVAKIFVHYDGYKRAEQIAGANPYWGLRLCVGTWMEGGTQMGKDVPGMIREFGARGRLWDIDFRNVSSPLPVFEETFPDEGYKDMYQVVKELRQVKYRSGMVPDHIPPLAGDTAEKRAGLAYCIACMKTWVRRANEEVG